MVGTDVGALLRHAREQHALSIFDIAHRTNICPHVLEAIERNALSEIPGGVYTRGYLRAFASEVGVDPERVVREYVSDFGSDSDVLDQLRARFAVVDHERHSVIQLLLIIACIACFLYVFAVPDAGNLASADNPQEQQSLHSPTPSTSQEDNE